MSEKKYAIVGLIRGHRDLKKYNSLIKRNNLLHTNFNYKYNYDVIIFHEGNINVEQQKYISEKSAGSENIKFINIADSWKKLEGKGYNKMCRFYSETIYNYLQEYTYVLRLDDDSYINQHIDYDIFTFMEEKGYDYGYIRRKVDGHSLTSETFVPFCNNYFKKNVKPMHNFYNNFSLLKIEFFNKKEVRNFMNKVIKSNGIVKYRWGDSNIQAVCVKEFSSKNKIHLFDDIKYAHGSHGYKNYPNARHEWSW